MFVSAIWTSIAMPNKYQRVSLANFATLMKAEEPPEYRHGKLWPRDAYDLGFAAGIARVLERLEGIEVIVDVDDTDNKS